MDNEVKVVEVQVRGKNQISCDEYSWTSYSIKRDGERSRIHSWIINIECKMKRKMDITRCKRKNRLIHYTKHEWLETSSPSFETLWMSGSSLTQAHANIPYSWSL